MKITDQHCEGCWKMMPIQEFMTKDGRIIYDKCRECRNKYKKDKQKHYRNRVKNQPQAKSRKNIRPILNYIIRAVGDICVCCGYDKHIEVLSIYDVERNTNIKDAIQQYTSGPTDELWDEVSAYVPDCLILCANCYLEYKNGLWIPTDEDYEKSNFVLPVPTNLAQE